MRTSHVTTTLVAVTAGLTAVTALQRRSGRRLSARARAPIGAAPDAAAPDGGGVVLPFVRPLPETAAPSAPTAPERPAAPARCGDSGGRTKAGTPCGARAAAAGRCHHHRQAA